MNPRKAIPLISIGLAWLAAGCAAGSPSPTASETSLAVTPASPATEAAPGTPVPEAPAETPTGAASPAASTGLPEGAAGPAMYALLADAETARATLDRVVEEGDRRFIPVLIELMRAGQIGIVRGAGYDAHVEALEALSGQDFGGDWPAWVEWYGGTDLAPPPGFTGWKGQLLGRIDPGFAEFLQDDAPARIRVEEIQWGGVRVDGIPALDEPAMIPADQADYLEPGEPVFGIALNGEARAYPLRILDWHEMANDTIGGVPVSLAYCTLCGAAIAYDGRAPNGETYTFGSSGFLFRSNKLMYDRQTRTLWNQLTGEPVLGELAGLEMPDGEPLRLDLLPVVLTSWEDWQDSHPDTRVLDLETGYDRPYTLGAAYGDYFSSSETMFPVWQRSEQLETKDRVYALRLDGVPKAYPLETLVAEGVVNDVVGETPVVLIAPDQPVEVEGVNLRAGAVSYEAGALVRAYDRGEQVFEPGPDPDVVIDSEGRSWQVTERALVGPEGEEAPRLPGHLAYWFGWFSFFPNAAVYGGGGS